MSINNGRYRRDAEEIDAGESVLSNFTSYFEITEEAILSPEDYATDIGKWLGILEVWFKC